MTEELKQKAEEYKESKRHKCFRGDVVTIKLNYESYLNNLKEAYIAGATDTTKKEYIRFGEIPKDEKSKKGNGIIGDGYKCIGYEEGVSVWDCVYNFDTGKYHLVAPHGNSCTHGDFSSMAFPDDCYGCDPKQKIYVVTGIEVGYGADCEPLLKDVKIVKELPFDYFSFTKNGYKE